MQHWTRAAVGGAAFLFLAAAGTIVDAAPDNTLGMALLSANINPDGSLDAGTGVVSSSLISNGYFVKFNRSIQGCTCSVFHGAATGSINAYGVASGYCPTPNATIDTAQVNIFDVNTGNFVLEPFQLMVFCPK